MCAPSQVGTHPDLTLDVAKQKNTKRHHHVYINSTPHSSTLPLLSSFIPFSSPPRLQWRREYNVRKIAAKSDLCCLNHHRKVIHSASTAIDGWLVGCYEFYFLATFKVLSKWARTCESADTAGDFIVLPQI